MRVLRPFFWDYPGEPVPEEILLHLHHPPIFTTDALSVATHPLYPGLGQAQNMLHCIPRVLLMYNNLKYH